MQDNVSIDEKPKSPMKKSRTLWLISALLLATQITSQADDLFQLFWRGSYYTKNGSGHIVAVSFTEQDFVNKVAQDNGLDPSTLVFVYRPDRRDTVVVRASTGQFIADVIQMEYVWTDVVNPTGAVTVRHALLFDEYHTDALGSFFGLELASRNANGGLVNDSLNGTVLYSKPDVGVVYGAKIWTGRRIADKTGTPP
jgi:hypothetical protein